jgi:hypothetical protein
MVFVRLRQKIKRERAKIQSDKRHRNKRQTDKTVCDTRFYNYNLDHYVRKSQWTLTTMTPVSATLGACVMENALGCANFPAIVCELP